MSPTTGDASIRCNQARNITLNITKTRSVDYAYSKMLISSHNEHKIYALRTLLYFYNPRRGKKGYLSLGCGLGSELSNSTYV
jgi:hypothetical protein